MPPSNYISAFHNASCHWTEGFAVKQPLSGLNSHRDTANSRHHLSQRAVPVHDIRFIRDNPNEFDDGLKRLGMPPAASELLALDMERRQAIADAEAAQAHRKSLSRAAGAAKSSGDEDEFDRLRGLVAENRDQLAALESQSSGASEALDAQLLALPNLPYPDVPAGVDETDNVELRRWGEAREFPFAPREHFEITAVQSAMDFVTASKLSGSRFVVLSGSIARLHRALAQFMLETHIAKHGLTEVWTPVIVRDAMMLGTGQLPKFGGDSYRLENGDWLIPTAEVTLTNIVNGLIVDEDYLPRRYCAWSQCFRSEAGAAGKDTAGMLRQHQFEKVEMVSVTRPDESEDEQQRMTKCAEAILEALELPYRTVMLCTGDMGFGAKRTFDIEVWLPGQNKFREISSISTCGDFQARRMNARYRPSAGGTPRYVHTLNGSGLAVGRSLIAVLENGQCEDGGVRLPEALAPYLGGASQINSDGALV